MDKEAIEFIADTYGLEAQMNQAIEEAAELIVAARKYLRAARPGTKERTALVGEMADVLIMVTQLSYLLEADFEIGQAVVCKLERQINRIHKEQEEAWRA